MDSSDIKVSILCLTYNHEKYIRDAMEGMLSQETDFAYEIIVHDDASTDGTADILREYAEKYPDRIRPVLQTENQYSRNVYIFSTFLVPLVRGKYIAMCEGDDYWTDPHKLQLQYDIMERNPQCSMCVHKIRQREGNGPLLSRYRPDFELEEGPLDTRQFLAIRRQYPFQTASFFMRSELFIDMEMNPPAFRKAADVGDEPRLLFMAAHGSIYYLPRCMSVYRIFSAGSWSSVYKKNGAKMLAHAQSMYEMMRLYDEYTGHAYDCELAHCRAKVLWLSGDCRALMKKEYRAYRKQSSLVKRIYIAVCAAFPFMSGLRLRVLKKRGNIIEQ